MANETKLAVILHADVVGSTELVQRDEHLAHERIRDTFRRFSEIASEHDGRTHEVRGDALVAEFSKASDATAAALAFQAENAARIESLADDVRPECRVGIALGEVIIADNTVTGAGVVLAQRLEQLAKPGGTCISAAVREALPERLSLHYQDLGEQTLKGFEQPQRAYAVSLASEPIEPGSTRPGTDGHLERASVAVLPFDNMTSDPEQSFFADGMVEDIITSLSRFREFVVIARNSTFTYKGQSVNVIEAARELRARYIVEGSVRSAGSRIRVTAQLIDAEDGSHLWAERFDRRLEDIFDVQDEVTAAIVSALAPEVQLAEVDRVRRRPEDLNAWGQYHLALGTLGRFSRESFMQAKILLERAIELDPHFAPARIAWACVRLREVLAGYPSNRSQALEEAYAQTTRGLEVDTEDAAGRAALALYHGLCGNRMDALREGRRAVQLNPNLPWARLALGWVLYFVEGDAEGAIEQFDRSVRLSPRDPTTWRLDTLRGAAHRSLGELDDAEFYGRRACEGTGNTSHLPHMQLGATLAMAGKRDEARKYVAAAIEREPELSVSYVERAFRGQHERILQPLLQGLRAAGLRESN